MPAAAATSVHRRIALVGNPNSGKSTLFNALTGLHQKTGNFPGVTVDKKHGTFRVKHHGQSVEVTCIDLPGTYSLYPKSLDERVACEVLTDPQNADFPDLTVIVADATNLKRSLFLAGQIIDLGRPCLLVLNMIDEAAKSGLHVEVARLSNRLGIPVLAASAREKTGISELRAAICEPLAPPAYPFTDLSAVAPDVVKLVQKEFPGLSQYQALHKAHLLFSEGHPLQALMEAAGFTPSGAQAEESLHRHGVIGEHIAACTGSQLARPPFTRKLDRILTHRIGGYIVFLLLLFVMFQSIFYLAEYPMSWIETGFAALRAWCSETLPAGWLTDLFTEGILAGLSGVVVFVPQIALLFFFIALLEDSGYMARVSFIMDKLMRRFGLHGRSVIPLISGMACAVPAIMSTRTISSWKERIITIMVTPLMSCSARLPVYTLLIALIIPDRTIGGIFHLQALTLMGLYLLGFFMALLAAWVMNLLIKTRERSWFIMEMPVYRLPKWNNVLYTIYEKVRVFVIDAGKVILIVSVVLWFLASYGYGGAFDAARKQEELIVAKIEEAESSKNAELKEQLPKLYEERAAAASHKLEESFAGQLGKFIEPAIRPLGYDWKIGISLITSLAAREVFVGTMATIYGAGDEENVEPIREVMRKERDQVTGKPVYSVATGLSLLIFYAFALQCISTIAVVKRETNSWMWPSVQFIFMGVLAYLSSWLVFVVAG
ncbi:MAG: ferrous iron transport protein B [Bacteroidia bacterium]|jgi:ferrous iron transport protein B|nr:ferrous iron transport protein B [Bacteroidia bacterium]